MEGRMAKIKFESGAFAGHEITVPDTGLTLGRGGRSQLVVKDDLMSAEHASLSCENGIWWLHDANSSNGTKINGEKVRSAALQDGDRIGLGKTAFTFFSEGQAASERDNGPKIRDVSDHRQSREDGHTVVIVAESGATKSEPSADVPPETPSVVGSGAMQGGADRKTQSDDALQEDDVALIDELCQAHKRIKEQLSNVIIGQGQVIDEVMMAVFSRGHALLVGVPGLAKTLLISTLSHVLDLSFKRIQFTPDLMPSDITGTEVLEEDPVSHVRSFRFVKGPVFCNMLLADEINRTPPKTQSALLEAMQEHRTTVGSQTYHLPEPFFVLATQNPIEQEGTYPLPEAQLDRFMFNIVVDYPTAEEESRIISQVTGRHEVNLQVAMDGQKVLRLQQLIPRVPAAGHVIDYARDLARATRPKREEAPDFVREMVAWGAGPRAGIYLITAAKIRALLQGRYHTTTADVTAVALPVLRHRVLTTFNAEAAGVTSDDIVKRLIEHLRPREDVDL
jgi:MoxR-like ATPase